jgi:hypothetical protein
MAKIIVVYILIFKPLDNKLEDRRFCTDRDGGIQAKIVVEADKV